MSPFDYVWATSLSHASEAARGEGALLLAGGTTVVDLMRGGALRPSRLVDISGLEELRQLDLDGPVLRFGALVTMADAAADPVLRRDYPALVESLTSAASQQIRNEATLGGNLLQRTRCAYFRDAVSACNKRSPGQGCSVLDGFDRDAAILGGSEHCVAVYPGDWGTALAAFDAEIEIHSPAGRRRVPFGDFHREPNARPDLETVLQPGDVVVAVTVRATVAGRRSAYVKLRDRRSYAFATASAAVALDLRDGVVAQARVSLGGVATRPWRSEVAEQRLTGSPLCPEAIAGAADAAFAPARILRTNGGKLRLGPRALAEAIRIAAGRGGPA